MKKIDADEFEQLVRGSKGDVYVDFFADWCGPCRRFERTLKAIDDETIYQVNIDDERALAMEFEVMSIPCLVLFRDGKEINRSVGIISKKKIKEMRA